RPEGSCHLRAAPAVRVAAPARGLFRAYPILPRWVHVRLRPAQSNPLGRHFAFDLPGDHDRLLEVPVPPAAGGQLARLLRFRQRATRADGQHVASMLTDLLAGFTTLLSSPTSV